MKIHEYQAKAILARHGVAVPRGRGVTTLAEVKRAAAELGGKVVVKAQIHAGGRGKGRLVGKPGQTAAMYAKLQADPSATEGAVRGPRSGGVRLAESSAKAVAEARKILGKYLVTHQTGPEGKKVQRLLIEEQSEIADEYYAAVLIDSTLGAPVLIVSREGGQAIEEVAARTPKAIVRVPVDPAQGFPPYKGRELAKRLKLPHAAILQAGALFAGLYRAFLDSDASLTEINPVALTADGRLLALDAKMVIDDSAWFRQPLAEWRDKNEEEVMEIAAEEAGVGSYVKLEGNIGCMVNGAGLAMATMDTIKLAGGEPANFLDIGTVNRVERVIEALRIINLDPDVSAILINIFGGMARVDVVAEGVVAAHKKFQIKHPTVVRLNGSNVEEGRQILEAAGLDLIVADDLGDAARKVVAAAGGA